ncbi:MAG TPA: hypothetical protein VD996_03205 [Chitinophagaceae bacterium]|nr:hypothetical protein [Chitinophagaceae bacterium]
MKKAKLILVAILPAMLAFGPARKQTFVSQDINNFWDAYDKIVTTKDSTRQHELIRELYISKGTHGLKSLMNVRNYSAREFIDAINKYPKFWKSLRTQTLSVHNLYPEVESDIQKLKTIYPGLKPATIYFSVGAFRTNGTISGDAVLIGSELALADSTIVTEELPQWMQSYFKEFRPRNNLALLCTHEYIHTQQKPLVQNLLSRCLYEGVAEFISCKATGKRSNTPGVQFGKANKEKVVNKFVDDLFLISNDYNWLWGENRNELKVRDLGYFIGYEICERYYNLSKDKSKAIRELIELDYSDEKEVERIVDATKLLPESLKVLYERYEKQRPTVTAIQPFKNGDKQVKPGLCQITLTFSEAMDTNFRGFDYGPLGDNHIYKFVRLIGWSDDKRTLTYEVELQPNKRFQFLVTNNFRNAKGIRLKPYLVDFETGN